MNAGGVLNDRIWEFEDGAIEICDMNYAVKYSSNVRTDLAPRDFQGIHIDGTNINGILGKVDFVRGTEKPSLFSNV